MRFPVPVSLDHDVFGRNPSKDMNVIESDMIEHDVVRKPVPTFRHHALAAAFLSLAVSAASAEDTTPRDYGVQQFTPKNFHLPEGGGCSGDIARWKAVQANDYAGGNVNLKIYGQIQTEIARAEEACAAGREREAVKMVSASKARHGYPQ